VKIIRQSRSKYNIYTDVHISRKMSI